MKQMQEESRLQRKMILAAALGACAVLLFVADRLVGGSGAAGGGIASVPAAEQAGMEEVVDTLLARHGIPQSAVRTWRVLSSDKKPLRIEQRIAVSKDFLSLVFNNELNTRLAPFGGHVVGTERTRENTVTLHIVRGGTTVRSVAFVMTPDR
jgi:hypothetical protein